VAKKGFGGPERDLTNSETFNKREFPNKLNQKLGKNGEKEKKGKKGIKNGPVVGKNKVGDSRGSKGFSHGQLPGTGGQVMETQNVKNKEPRKEESSSRAASISNV